MDPLSVIVEIFVVTVTGAIFGGVAMLIALDALADKQVLKNASSKQSPLNPIVQQIQPGIAQQASNAAPMPKVA